MATAVPPAQGGAISAGDLAEVMTAFQEVTSRLQGAHEALRAEVARLEAELRAANEQVERSARLATVGELAAGIAHEVRNPLGSIRLYARMLEDDLADRPEARALAQKIGLAVTGLDAVVGDVLALSRELTARKAPAEASGLLDRALDACRGCAPGWPSVEVRRGDRARGGAVVWCDAGLAHRALVNVIRNAVEAMAESGACARGSAVLLVDVRRRQVRGAGGVRREMVGLAVSDTGPGVTGEVLARMFNPFFTTRAAGTGLGLAIVHRIMDAHGGQVQVRNRREGGAVVELLFPAGEAA